MLNQLANQGDAEEDVVIQRDVQEIEADEAEEVDDFYNQEAFEAGYKQYFDIQKKETVPGTKRVLYLLKNKA